MASLLLAGCSVGPDFKPPSLWSPTSWFDGRPPDPAHLAAAGQRRSHGRPLRVASVPVESPPDPHWWDQFGDPELSALEVRVAHANLDVRLATIRLVESRAQLRVTAANEFPSLNGSAAYTRTQLSSKEFERGLSDAVSSGGLGNLLGNGNTNALRAEAGSIKIPALDEWQDGIDASWELDLWGRVRRSVESAHASLQASEEDRRSVLITQFSEVARDYMMLRGLQAQLAILHDDLRVAQQAVTLTRQRFTGGLTTDLDVENAVSQVDTTAAQIPDLERQVAQQVNALGYLLGEPPRALRDELDRGARIPPVPPSVPVGVPSELARRRPDIREAEAQLHAATASVGVAVANFYPKVTLSAGLNFESLSLRDLGFWSARAYNFGPTISLPIFQGGRLRGQLELNEAQQQEAAINYQKTVLQAWQDVDNALTAYEDEQRRRDALDRSVRSARRALDLAQQQYAHGLQTFINVLDAERSLFNAQGQLASSTATVSSDLVQLYNALGGGWERTFPLRGAQASAAGRAGNPPS
ncbi:efflux transporter outer membrane subunit [Lichenicoccus roseus]|uniref:Efflux transporter outer membrane subunit n=2 Tax=Lichenicoccus roseus TaxID=2683649 RepID=A0A5R9J7F6_9PROT|nr:efflux transporter outer membrane subunit [Lichenicoccus roseus]